MKKTIRLKLIEKQRDYVKKLKGISVDEVDVRCDNLKYSIPRMFRKGKRIHMKSFITIDPKSPTLLKIY